MLMSKLSVYSSKFSFSLKLLLKTIFSGTPSESSMSQPTSMSSRPPTSRHADVRSMPSRHRTTSITKAGAQCSPCLCIVFAQTCKPRCCLKPSETAHPSPLNPMQLSGSIAVRSLNGVHRATTACGCSLRGLPKASPKPHATSGKRALLSPRVFPNRFPFSLGSLFAEPEQGPFASSPLIE